MEIPSTYNWLKAEDEIYSLWEKNGLFIPKIDKKKKPYTIIMPPPNANASLHIGHALYVIQDILIRFERMRGKSALYLPGADHAGFETQVVYEKHLEKEGKSRFDFKREEFYQAVWDFVHENRPIMESQLRKLGMSCDWSRAKFTLDPDIVDTVYDTFKKMYKDGLVYRKERIVNYCTKHGTGLSDLEVEHEEREGSLWHIDYPIEGSESSITVATTRPETMLGDTAVAVNPKDKRYKKLVGKNIILPIISRKIPIIADDAVDMKFGTGAVKVTPFHDPLDFEIAERHELPKILVIGMNGRMTSEAKEFKGLKIKEAREKVVEKLDGLGALKNITPHKSVLSLCYKCKNVLEPLPLDQWWVATEKLAKPAIDAVKKNKIKFVPKRMEKLYFNWMENIRDWNISRQNWWGIPIPAWFHEPKCIPKKGHEGEEILCEQIVISKTEPECEHCDAKYIQDTDTFDTWFWSGQWPFATLGYPDSEDYKYFYPTNVMETGWDIIFFWVARMIMLGLYVTKEIPFKTVYLHGLLRDKEGQKISKSKGNVIDPMDMVERYGSDALRVGLIMGSAPGNDTSISEDKIRGYRNFANKIWNAARFVMSYDANVSPKTSLNQDDKEFLKKLNETVKKVSSDLEKLRISDAASEIYQFFWHYYADVYIEKTKNRREEAQSMLLRGLIVQLKLLHPFLPFVTEAIWQELNKAGLLEGEEPFLIKAPWPTEIST